MTTEDKLKIVSNVKTNLKVIRGVLDEQVSPDDIVGVQDKLIKLVEVAGLASYTEAMAKAVYEHELSEALELLTQDPDNNKVGANNLTTIAKGKCSSYLSAVTYAERLGRNISHSMDALRTIISLQKEEMNRSHWAGQT